MKKMRFYGIAAAALVAASLSTAALNPAAVSAAEVQAVSAAAVISSAASHNFTTQGLNSDYFTISGNLATGKGTATYAGQTLTQCLKMESATNIAFSTAGNASVTLVILEGQTLVIDGTKHTLDGSGKLTVQVGAGSHTITKGSGSSFLFYIDVKGDGSAPVQTTPPVQTETPAVQTTAQNANPPAVSGDIKVVSSGGWNEMLYATLSGVKDADVKAVSYTGNVSGKLAGDDLTYLVRDTSAGVRIDIPGVPAGTYTLNVETAKGTVGISGINVTAQDRSGYAHFNYTAGVGAYQDSGALKSNAIVLYVTNENKNTVSVTAKDGTKVTGIGNILNSAGAASTGGSKTNSNSGIIKKLADDGTPLVIRIIGNVKAPDGLTAYNSTDYGGLVGDNGFMARMKSGKDITIEGVGTDAVIDGWGIHFMAETAAAKYGKSFEVRNIAFKNVPEDCIGMEGVQSGSELTASVERCWIHNNEFYKPTIANPAESDKAGGDGACDFKRGMYFTNSYNYYEGYHKTNLVGASDSNLQFHLTYHHNYWKNCESRGPLARQANIHMYNNIFEGQTSYCQNTRANAYIFSEYNLFENCKSPQRVDSGAIKSFHDTLTNCSKLMQATTVTDKNAKVTSGNKYENFELNASVSYIPANKYQLITDTSKLKSSFAVNGGTLADQNKSGTLSAAQTQPPVTTNAATTATTTTTAATTITTSATAAPATTAAATTASTAAATTAQTAAETTAETLKATLQGDADCSGKVDVSDVVMMARLIAEDKEVVMTAQGKVNADVNASGVLDSEDTVLILKYIARLIDTF